MPDYTAAGAAWRRRRLGWCWATLEFNPVLMYFLADQPTPTAAWHNADIVMTLLVEREYQAESLYYQPDVSRSKGTAQAPGGTVFRAGYALSG